jgi:hypothetical protein
MSIKSKVFAAAATLTLVGGVGAASALTAGSASAATPSCGWTCVDIFSHNYGTHHHPGFVMDVLRQGEKVGQPVILFRTSNSDPAEDFTIAYQGQVSDFAAAGLMSPALALHYGGGCEFWNNVGHPPVPTCQKYFPNDFAFEFEYAPYGVDSGLCVGTPTTAAQDTFVSLQPCGASSKTVWVVDIANSTGHSFFNLYVPLINGSTTNFSHPYVLTYPQNSYPTDMPRPQLTTQTLQQFSNGGFVNGGTVNANQEWGGDFGPLS